MMITISALTTLQIILITVLAVTGILSAVLYWRRRRALEALLVLAALLPILILVLRPTIHSAAAANQLDYVLETADPLHLPLNVAQQVQQADRILLRGDGLFQRQWQDLPAKPVIWQTQERSTSTLLQLSFPQQLALGRVFHLEVKRSGSQKSAWRVQLLAENQQVLVEQSSSADTIQLAWLPPVAQRMVLHAKVWDEQQQLIDQGPIPLDVTALTPLQIEGRFAAPSFDTQSLNQLLLQSGAQLDWQTQLGKGIVRKENASSTTSAASTPSVLVQDAAYFEQMNTSSRQQLLARVADGASLIILGANAQQVAFWSQTLGLSLRPAAKDNAEIVSAQGLRLSATNFQVQLNSSTAWQEVDAQNWLFKRDWKAGHILWLAVADWHQSIISDPDKVKAWWQSLMDASGATQSQSWTMQLDDETTRGNMPLIGLAQQLCAQGLEHQTLQIEPDHSRLQLQPVSYKVDAHCVAFWPKQSGWQDWRTLVDSKADAAPAGVSASGAFYVFQASDWPSWQRQQRQAASLAYMQRLPLQEHKQSKMLPDWPWILLSMAACLMLWRREQHAV